MTEIMPMDFEVGVLDDELPSYTTKGRVLVYVLQTPGGPTFPRKYKVLDEDPNTSTFWVQEGVGWDYWLDTECVFPEDGDIFVIEGIRGDVRRGDGWETDDTEDWEYDQIRKASPTERANRTLDPL